MSTLFVVLEGFTAAAFAAARAAGALPSLDAVASGGCAAGLGFPLADARVAMLVSAMTGAWPDEHGILLANMGDPVARTLRPATPRDRARVALWEALDAQGVGCLSVGWPLAVTGRTERSAVVAAGFGQTLAPGFEAPSPELFYPPGLAAALADCWLRPDELEASHLEALAPGWRRADPAFDRRPGVLALAVAENVSRHAAFLALLKERRPGFATLCLSLPGELVSLERAGAALADGLFDGLAERGAALLEALLAAVLAEWPADGQVIVAGIPHAETPTESGFVLVSGPVWSRETFPGHLVVPALASLAWGACGFRDPQRPEFDPAGAFTAGQVRSDFSRSLRLHATDASPDWDVLLTPQEQIQKLPNEGFSPGEQWHLSAVLLLGRSRIARGDWAGAVPALEARLRLEPMHQPGWLLLSECHQRLGRLAEALDAAYAAIHPMHGNNPIALLRAAELEALSGDPGKARKLLRQAEPELPFYPQNRALWANVLIFLRDWPGAEAVLTRLVAETPANGYLRYRLARCLLARGAWQAAFDQAMESLRLEPGRALAHELLGHALAGMGLLTQAQQAFELAVAADPRWPRPRAARVVIARRLKRPAEEIARLQEDYQRVRGGAEGVDKP
jgi:tetratricopeptide (TPR) repeat protein